MKWNKYLSLAISAPIISGAILGLSTETVHAAKAGFAARLNPATLNLSVNLQGGIGGRKTTQVTATRSKRGSSALCNKIKAVEVVKGMDPHQNIIGRRPIARRGRCYFTVNLNVQPFSDDEIRAVCSRGTTGTQRLRSDGLATAYNTTTQELDRERAMRASGGQGGHDALSIVQIKYAANVSCQGKKPITQKLPTKPAIGNATGAALCDLQGWWKLSSGVSSRDGEWKFYRKSSSKTQGNYSSKGSATKRNGGLIFGNGSGNATISSNKAFSWKLNNNLNCNGKANNSCSVIAGLCKGRVSGAKMYPFNLRKSNGPVDTGVKNPAGKPTTNTGSAIPQIKAPGVAVPGIWKPPIKP